MTDTEAYNWTHRILGSAKRDGWKISRTAAGCWRVSHPCGRGVTIGSKPTARALLEVERQLRRIERSAIIERSGEEIGS